MVKFTRSRYFALGLLLALAFGSMAATVSYFGAGSADQLGVSLATLISGEDQTNNVLRVEQQYSRGLAPDADTLIKTGAGFIHSFVCSGDDAASVVGTIQLRDAVAAGAGTVLATVNTAIAIIPLQGVVLDIPVTVGVYVDFTTTADVTCIVSYR